MPCRNGSGACSYTGQLGTTFFMQPDRVKYAADDTSGATNCDIEEMRAPELFRFSWYMPGTPKTMVAISSRRRCESHARHAHAPGWDQFPPEMVRAIHGMLDGGWKSHVLPNLKVAAEAINR